VGTAFAQASVASERSAATVQSKARTTVAPSALSMHRFIPDHDAVLAFVRRARSKAIGQRM
jgi:hypothetical protein